MEGERVMKAPENGKKKMWLIVTGVVLGALLMAYLGLCAWVGTMDRIFPNTTIAGLDVSGMTVEQARKALDQAMAEYGDEIAGTITYGEWRGTITASQMNYDWSASAQAAYTDGRDHFLTQGGQYAARLLGKQWSVETRSMETTELERLLDQMEQDLDGDVTRAAWRLEGDRLVMTKGRTGVSLDRESAREGAFSALEEAMEQKLGGGQEGNAEVERQLYPEEIPPQEPDFDEIYTQFHTEPVSAQMDPDTFQITDHVVGVDFDVDALKAAYEGAAEGETFSIPVTLTQPKETKASLEEKLFQDLLGEGTTRVTGSANRKFNVKLSAEACNNVILLPGQEFSYNNTTGSRTPEKGYKNAPTYQAGKSVDDIGGGICQTSSTIYYAVLHTPLEVVERHDHQFNTGYVDLGMDATVYFGSLDFRFKNNTEYPVKIVTSSYDSNGSRYLNVKIYGTNPDGIYAIPKSSVFDKVAPTTKYEPDPSVAQGTLVLDKEQYAYTGWSAHTYRYIYDKDGNLLEKQDMGSSKYSMRPNLYHYNPADGDPSTWPDGKPPQPGTDPGTEVPVDPSTETGGTAGPGTEGGAVPGTGEGEAGTDQPAQDQPASEQTDAGESDQTQTEGVSGGERPSDQSGQEQEEPSGQGEEASSGQNTEAAT